jgi:hypothetical protein
MITRISPKSLTNYTDQRWGWRCHRSRQYIDSEGKEQRTVDVHCDKVITIDNSPVGTIDFNLTDIEKQFLLRVGKAAALTFLHARNFDEAEARQSLKAKLFHLSTINSE